MNLEEYKQIALNGEKDPIAFQETFNPPTILAMVQLCEAVRGQAHDAVNDLMKEQSDIINDFRGRLHSSLSLMQALLEEMTKYKGDQYPKEAVVKYIEDCIQLGMGLKPKVEEAPDSKFIGVIPKGIKE
tara:strand:+ start:784 stop:1170 length:387 start_codon:yes stop_codon:yes gene_type:complete